MCTLFSRIESILFSFPSSYNPRARERELGRAAQLAKGERVFSDSEIYSPVFPRGKPEQVAAAEEEVLERVKAMKREFKVRVRI